MKTYRNIQYKIINKHFVHFYNPKGSYHHDTNQYGRDLIIRSFPENCKLSHEAFAKTVIDQLWARHDDYRKNEKRLYYVAKSNRFIKNVCK